MQFIDIEVYPNYLLVMFKRGDKFKYFQQYPGRRLSDNDRSTIKQTLSTHTTVGFNSLRYDLPLLVKAVNGASCEDLYKISKAIVENNRLPWQVASVPEHWDHIDIKEVAPGVMVSLKLYGGRIGSRKLQDLPIDPHSDISPEQRDALIEYCKNDVTVTDDLYQQIVSQLEMRKSMSQQYNINLMSKSDAQIAEAVLVSEIGDVQRPVDVKPSKYNPPKWMWFESDDLKHLFADVLQAEFNVSDKGKLLMPKVLNGRAVNVGNSKYKLGIGGLHSSEKSVAYHAGDRLLVDIDVASYYPAIILEQELYPPQCGRKFLSVYRKIVERRLEAKRKKDMVVANSLKITINGSFGKLGSQYSKLFAPDLFKQVTVTGQLALLMLIEHLEMSGIPVISGNTDGIVTNPTADQLPLLRNCVAMWESVTGYDMEETHYSSIHFRNVNNYIAITTDGKVKTKGCFASSGLMKNPQMPVVAQAVVNWLKDKTPIGKSIRAGKLLDYLTVRTVKGGGQWRGSYLGKVVRWYWSTDGDPITYVTNGNKVATSDGAKPLMELPESLPDDIDYQRYEQAAVELLEETGHGTI